MKNTVLSILLALLVLVSFAHAADGDIVSINKTKSPILFNGDNKDSLLSRTEVVPTQGIIRLTNKLNSTFSVKFGSMQLTHASGNGDTINVTQISPIALGKLEKNKVITLSMGSVSDIESGRYSGILTVVNSSNNVKFDEIPLDVLVPALEVSKITVKDKESDISDTKLEKGQTFTVTVDIKNIAEQTDLENVNVKVGIYKGDKEISQVSELISNIDGDDLEDDTDVKDLTNGKTGSATFEFQMPFDIDDGDSFTVLAEVTADSQDTPASFYAADTKSIEATVKDDAIEVTKATITPSSLACGVNKAKITATVRNIGANNQDTQMFLRNIATGFEKQLNGGDDVELDDNYENEDDFTQTVEELVILSDLKAGQNTYTLVVYYKDGDATEQKDIVVTSQSCDATVSTDSKTTISGDNSVVVVPPTSQPTTTNTPVVPVSNPSYVTLKDVSGFGLDSDLILPIVIGVGGLIVGVIVALLVMPRP